MTFNIKFLEAEIEKRKMSKTRFAHECGISYRMLKKWLSGDLRIGVSVTLKISDYLNVKPSVLFC